MNFGGSSPAFLRVDCSLVRTAGQGMALDEGSSIVSILLYHDTAVHCQACMAPLAIGVGIGVRVQ